MLKNRPAPLIAADAAFALITLIVGFVVFTVFLVKVLPKLHSQEMQESQIAQIVQQQPGDMTHDIDPSLEASNEPAQNANAAPNP